MLSMIHLIKANTSNSPAAVVNPSYSKQIPYNKTTKTRIDLKTKMPRESSQGISYL
jgi:hypothetical protein